jgi:hypothetical protein
MATKKRFWIGVSAVFVLVLIGAALGISYRWGGGVFGYHRYVRPGPLAPNADEAPLAESGAGGTPASLPKCKWPDNFKLDMNIKLDAPEVPEKIKGPLPEEPAGKN